MKEKKKSLKERGALWRKEEILSAARSVFVRKGYHRSTMDDVAREAGVSKGALYLYFSSKENFLRALVDEGLKGRLNLVKEILDKKDTCFNKIKQYVNHTFEYFEKNRDLLTVVMMLERDVLCEDLHKTVHEKATKMIAQVIKYLTEIMKQGIKEGFLKDKDPEIMAVGLGGMVQMFVMRAIFYNIKGTLNREKEFIIETFLEGVKA